MPVPPTGMTIETAMIRKSCCTLLLASALALPLHAEDAAKAPSAEQQAMMEAYEKMGRIGEQHQGMARYAGKWTYENSMWTDPAQAPATSTGTAESTPLWGGRYIETVFKGEYQGQPFEGRSFAGYDNLKGKYVATWIDSMSTAIFITYGTHDAATDTTTFRGEMDDPLQPGKIIPVRQVDRWIDADHYVFEWYETREGKEAKTMEIRYARVK